MKKSLPDNVDSGAEADSESEEDAMATRILEPTVAYLDSLDCNNPTEDEREWVISEDVAFVYSLCLEDVFKFVNISPLHMPLPISEMTCMHIEDNEWSCLHCPSKKNKSLIVFGRV